MPRRNPLRSPRKRANKKLNLKVATDTKRRALKLAALAHGMSLEELFKHVIKHADEISGFMP